jgi:hypothetical protein
MAEYAAEQLRREEEKRTGQLRTGVLSPVG